MATLNVTNLQNTAATVTNVSLLADGTTTLVLNATGTSRLGGLRYNAGNLEVYTAGAVWASIGGGSTYTATAPIKVTGTVISVDLGLGVAANGANLALKVPVAATPPAIGTGAAQAFDGSMYWDDTLGQLFIRYINGGTSTWVAAAPPAGGVPAASLAEAAAGVTTVKYSSPATAVPKDAANMTGAAIIPGGADGGRPGTPSGGMFRYNTTYNPDTMEYYDGTAASWKRLVNYDQLALVAIDGYSTTVNGLVANDLPLVGSPLALTWIDIPVGYTNLFITSTYQALCAYNTTGQPPLQPYNYTTYGPAPGPSNATTISFQSVSFGGGANFQNTGMVVNGSGSVSGLNPATSYSVGVYGAKATGGGQVQVYDISINVLAWNINP